MLSYNSQTETFTFNIDDLAPDEVGIVIRNDWNEEGNYEMVFETSSATSCPFLINGIDKPRRGPSKTTRGKRRLDGTIVDCPDPTDSVFINY